MKRLNFEARFKKAVQQVHDASTLSIACRDFTIAAFCSSCDTSLNLIIYLQIFGKLMVCKDMDTAVRLSKVASHISFVTIQGDQVNKKGTMTGGYIDKTR